MSEIVENQKLEIDNLLSYRGKINQMDVGIVLSEMKKYVQVSGAKVMADPVVANYGTTNCTQGMITDIELLLPIDKEVVSNEKFHFKSKLRIVNAIIAKHRGPAYLLQESCNQLSNYITQKKYTPITTAYNVTVHNKLNLNDTSIDVYVGISPNLL